MKQSVKKKADELANRLYRIAMRQPAAKREAVVQMALFESEKNLPAVYRILRSRGYSMLSSLGRTYGAYLSYPNTRGLGDADEDAILDELMTQATGGSTSGDTASPQTSEERGWSAGGILDLIEGIADTAVDVGGAIYGWVTGDAGTGAQTQYDSQKPPPSPQYVGSLATPEARARYLSMISAGPAQAPGGGSTGMSTPMSPTTIALGVGAAVLVGYALLGGKKKKKGK